MCAGYSGYNVGGLKQKKRTSIPSVVS